MTTRSRLGAARAAFGGARGAERGPSRVPGLPRLLRQGRPLAAAGAIVVLLATAGCVAIPTSGSVGAGVDAVSDQQPIMPLADLPATDASPAEIVSGFLSASAAGFNQDTGVGSTDDFTGAREYLTGQARRTWNPRASVVVYPTTSIPAVELVPDTSAEVQVSLTVAAKIDEDGRYAEAAPGTPEALVFSLVEDAAGQWRISALQDGVVLSEPNFELIFRASPIYFLSADKTYLVPEERWFPVRNLATWVVRALLAGPSEWLRDGVRTAVVEGTQLVPDAVNVGFDGTADVGLSRGGLPPDPDDRALLMAQLTATLAIPTVGDVSVTADDVPIGAEAAQLSIGAPRGATLEVLADGVLSTVSMGKTVPVDGITEIGTGAAHAFARNADGSVRVFLDGSSRLATVPVAGAAPTTILTAPGLVAPSVDRLGWVWTASPALGVLAVDAADALAAGPALDPATSATVVEADWIAQRKVLGLRVSADASRIAVVSENEGKVVVEVAAVIRDSKGHPRKLGQPLGVGAVLTTASQVVWVDDVTLGVLGQSGTSTTSAVHLVPVGGPTVVRPTVAETASIAAGAVSLEIYLVTMDGELYQRSEAGWSSVLAGVSEPSFPG